jgi:hypothetical protein
MPYLRRTLLATALLASGLGLAYAQGQSPYDPAQLPTIKGRVAQYLPTPRGDVDGLILDDGTEVHVPPHLSTQLVFAVKPGDTITVHGLKARAVPLVAAASVTNDASGVTVAWAGPPHLRDDSPIEVTGTVKAPLYDPRGEVAGVLLADGTVVHLPPPEARRLADQLAPGKAIVARGAGYAGPLGKSLDAREVGPDAAHLVTVAGPRPPMGERWWRERMGHMRPGMMDMHGDGGPPPPPPPGAPPEPPPQ